MYYPLTPVFCTPKDEAERKKWRLMFRINFGNITPIQFKKNELRLEKRCSKHSVEYVAPQLTDSVEAIHERKTQLQKKCKAATDKKRRSHPSIQEKERTRKRSRNRKRNDPVNDKNSSELRTLNDKNSSELRTFRITGRGGTPNYSYLPVAPYSTFCLIDEEGCSSARSQVEPLALGGEEQVGLNEAIGFYICYDKVLVKKRNKVFMDGWRVVMCDTTDVLSAEIYINDNCTKRGASVGCLPSTGFFHQVKESNYVMLGNDGTYNYTDVLQIIHYDFKGDSSISVEVVADIPEGRVDIIQEAKRMVKVKQNSKNNWNGKELYDYLNDQGITQVRFKDVCFDVSAVRAGSNAHQIIQRKIMELDYKAGRTNEKPPALTRPRSKGSNAKGNVYYPLTPIFCIPRDSVEESEWKERFLKSFHVSPVRFRLNEEKLVVGCKKNSVRYIAPQLEDSVDETLRRKYALTLKIQSSKYKERCRKRKEQLWEEASKRAKEERRQANEKRAEEERKRWAAMSPEEKADETAVEKYEEEERKRKEEKWKRWAALSPEEKAREEAQAKLKTIEAVRKQRELERRWHFMSPEEKARANQKTAEEEREYQEWLHQEEKQKAHDKLKRRVLSRKRDYYGRAGTPAEASLAWSKAYNYDIFDSFRGGV